MVPSNPLITLKKFISKYTVSDGTRPFLLALSGGPDSLALYYCLKILNVPFAVAHVDHGWRSESSEQANQLQKLCSQDGVPFFLKRLNPQECLGNLENACRDARYLYFKEIGQQINAQGVFLGHHLDDHAETIFKRIAEGSHLTNLKGIQKVSMHEGMRIYRPFIGISKQSIVEWLHTDQSRFTAFEDCTNNDPRFLRGKLRTHIIPLLSKEFGKEIRPSLQFLAEEANELDNFLNEITEAWSKQVVRGKLGLYINLAEAAILPMFPLKYLIRKILQQQSLVVSRDILNQIAEAIKKGLRRRFFIKKFSLHVDRQRLFISTLRPTISDDLCQWKITSNEILSTLEPSSISWKEVWKGSWHVDLPIGNYELAANISSVQTLWNGKKLGSWWGEHGVPVFMRSAIPVIMHQGVVQSEFLSGREQKFSTQDRFLRFHFEYIDME